MTTKRIKQAIFDITSTTVDYAWWFMLIPTVCVLTLLFASFVFPSIVCWSSVMLTILFFVAELLIHAAFGEHFDEEQARRNTIWLKATFIIIIFYMALCPFLWISAKISNRSIAYAALLFVGLPVCILCAAIFRAEKGKKIWSKIETLRLALESTQQTVSQGDIVLCVDIALEKELSSGVSMLSAKAKKEIADKAKVVIPYKDRFLHMLMLGPTGSGKTSQILLPMIMQDIQNKDAGVIVMDPKGDLARQAYFMSVYQGRSAKLFDPELDNCLHFNPLAGREDRVVPNLQKTFTIMMSGSSDYFQNMTAQCVGNAGYLLKRLDRYFGQPGKYATLLNLSAIIQDIGKEGRTLVNEFAKAKDLPGFSMDNNERRQNNEIVAYFSQKYYVERSKEFEACSGLRSNLSALCSNEYLRNVLNPDVTKGEMNDIDFDKALEDGEVLCISTAQGLLGNLSGFIGYFFTLQLQASVLRRPGNEDTRRPCFLYIDEFQTYANMGFADMLTQGRSYRVASHLATQARAQIGMNAGRDGKTFTDLVSTNARSVVIFPGVSPDDALYYSKKFGEEEREEVQVGITRRKFDFIRGGLSPMGHASESIRTTKKLVSNFSPTDIMYRPFGEITYSIVQDGSLRQAKAGRIEYIPKEVKKYLDDTINPYVAEHRKLSADEVFENKRQEEEKGFVMETESMDESSSSATGDPFSTDDQKQEPLRTATKEVSFSFIEDQGAEMNAPPSDPSYGPDAVHKYESGNEQYSSGEF